MSLPITVVVGLDRASAQHAAMQLLGSGPGARLIQHCLDQLGVGLVSRTVTTGSGSVKGALIDAVLGCAPCTVLDDLLPCLRTLAADPAVDAAVLLLPEAADPIGFLESFFRARDRAGRATADYCHIETMVAVVDAAALVPRLAGDKLLSRLGIAAGPQHDRSAAETLLAGVESADVIVAAGATDQEQALLRLLNPDAVVVERAAGCLRNEFDFQRTVSRTIAGHLPAQATDTVLAGAWRIQWRSSRPLHPQRLRETLTDIADIALRGRGYVRLADRLATVTEWDSIDGALRLESPADPHAGTDSALCFIGVSERWHVIHDRLNDAELADDELPHGTEEESR